MNKKKSPPRPAKMANLTKVVRQCMEQGRYLDTFHGSGRKEEREISLLEIKHVLLRGRHVPARDRYEEAYGDLGWSYCFEGKTVDKRPLRVVVAFDEETQMLIVTAVALGE